ncbi:MAG TPA: N-acetylglucosamine-6-phosphate deacetylase [Prevotellaceae bacterium]|jgi:N-acetylglucosamine-6-phosphate deacetylase|nr:N-acetylglucosamine-6-phosphate deacetylase [Prevotellaceae bacterium]
MAQGLKQIVNGRILTSQGWLRGGSVIINGSTIVEVSKSECIPDEVTTVINAKGGDIVPGAIELHAHGAGGSDFMEGTVEAFRNAINTHMRHGTTSIYPTLSSSSVPMIEAAIQTTEQLMSEENTPVLGLHLEGPYFNKEMAGGQMPQYITPPIKEDYEMLINSTSCIKRWDEAPELRGSEEFGRFCSTHGVLPAIAHTKAEYMDVSNAYEAGFTHATHFYNAMTGFHKVREYKHEGTVESIYAIPDMTVEVIADGIHVPPVMLKIIYDIKGVERTALITDALACTDCKDPTAFDPRVIIEDGVCKLSDRSALAGSVATSDRLIKVMVKNAGIRMADAVRMSAETPAHIMGEDHHVGIIRKGYDADITIYDSNIDLQFVMQKGNIVVNNL